MTYGPELACQYQRMAVTFTDCFEGAVRTYAA